MMRCQLYRGNRHFYMLQLSHDRVIDGTRFGGRMRFINHACTLNCRLEKWNIRGQERCGVFTIRPVHAGDEITVDYGFQYVHRTVRQVQDLLI
ncbi:hypothetical protein DVH05_004409 [Phytophthora capsici]|nr:hypothetical protein DVH05_004409 [Phytophthora capsici]